MMKRLLPLVCLTAVGCVSSGKYDAARAELRACQADGDKQKDAYAELEKSKAQSEDKLRQLTGELQDLGTQSKKLENEKGNLSESMTKLQSELIELRRQEEAERARAAIFQDLVEKLKGMIDAGKLQVYIRNGRMLVKLPDNVLFDPGKTDIKSAGKDAIAQLTAVLQAIPDRNFQVAGHTDNTPIHTAKYPSNWELSTERAVNLVKFFMIKSGDGIAASLRRWSCRQRPGGSQRHAGRQGSEPAHRGGALAESRRASKSSPTLARRRLASRLPTWRHFEVGARVRKARGRRRGANRSRSPERQAGHAEAVPASARFGSLARPWWRVRHRTWLSRSSWWSRRARPSWRASWPLVPHSKISWRSALSRPW